MQADPARRFLNKHAKLCKRHNARVSPTACASYRIGENGRVACQGCKGMKNGQPTAKAKNTVNARNRALSNSAKSRWGKKAKIFKPCTAPDCPGKVNHEPEPRKAHSRGLCNTCYNRKYHPRVKRQQAA